MDSKILVVPSALAQKMDDNRGDMSRVEFIGLLIDNLVNEKPEQMINDKQNFVTRAELISFEHEFKRLLKNFLDFFLVYDLEREINADQPDIEKFTKQLQDLQKRLSDSAR